ncbi:zinc metalloprotease [Bacillus thermotolerans]|uniref:Peptidase M50 domain-containing protein n=1 Tax=Bacillus thermotolerans TaxID=1221996 RepID=A0A0F5HJH2_BACTR|nr:hypothetical protein [Bacillus thermotolerans]KKB33408.1 hypothetical protein QY97_03336 [Bacillus thermotolerans]KKB33957.1 hypothetical protein QY96_00294 [Bacillus thermotolerans]KKB36348.1 hypothetical protein QY95_03212 [Bacillus thermotolerans]
MFTLSDMTTFAWAFLITLPLTLVIHAGGHAFFAWLFGGKAKLTLGKGKVVFSLRGFELRGFYFIDAACYYGTLRKDKRWKHALIYAGGPLFNILSIFLVNGLIHLDILPTHMFFYQFVYFSIYFLFFSLLPIDYGKDNPSDGKAIYEVLRFGKVYQDFS